MANYVEIRTLQEFRAIRNGYIVITDNAYPNKIHSPSCPHVREKYFREKVVDNDCKNGRYYWTDEIRLAKRRWNVKLCPKCL